MKSIGIIVFYFGQFPWYYNFFIESCKRNQSIDFIFFTDNVTSEKKNQNINYLPFSIDKFNLLATEKLGFNVKVLKGLKICDFRPAFGLIFEDFIQEYDFWGYSDIDIIFGDVRGFITQDVTDNFEYVSVRNEYPSGFFSVFKNTKKMNRLFIQSKNYIELFKNEENTLFEECGGYYHDVVTLEKNILDTECPVETFHHVLEMNKNNVKCLFEFYSIEGTTGEIKISGNSIYFLNKYEVMMYHLTSFKNNIFTKEFSWESIPDSYIINRYSIQKNHILGKLIGKIIDYYCKKRMLFFIKIDEVVRYRKKLPIAMGIYRHMQDYIEVHEYSILLKSKKFNLYKSLFYKNSYCISDLNQYLKIEANKFSIISKDGNITSYQFVKNHLKIN